MLTSQSEVPDSDGCLVVRQGRSLVLGVMRHHARTLKWFKKKNSSHCPCNFSVSFRSLKNNNQGAVVENLPANAGDTGSSPGLGRSHMPWSNWACEPQLLSLGIWILCSATREAAIVRGPRTTMKSGPRSPQLEKALAQKRRPNTAINK